jgi:hypothetical protein
MMIKKIEWLHAMPSPWPTPTPKRLKGLYNCCNFSRCIVQERKGKRGESENGRECRGYYRIQVFRQFNRCSFLGSCTRSEQIEVSVLPPGEYWNLDQSTSGKDRKIGQKIV